jgi:hypothetical protein
MDKRQIRREDEKAEERKDKLNETELRRKQVLATAVPKLTHHTARAFKLAWLSSPGLSHITRYFSHC